MTARCIRCQLDQDECECTQEDIRKHIDEAPLFFPPFSNDSTSLEAAETVAPTSGAQRQRIYEWLQDHRATNEEIEIALGIAGNAVRPRMKELRGTSYGGMENPPVLVRAARGEDGEVLKRPTRSGCSAIVWECIPPHERQAVLPVDSPGEG